MPTDTAQRAYQANVNFTVKQFPLTSMTADVIPVRRPGADKSNVVTLCPDCAAEGTYHRVKEQFICPSDAKHGPFGRGEGAKGRDLGDDGYEPINAEDYQAAREPDLPEKELCFRVYRTADVAGLMRPDTNAYRIRASGKVNTSMKAYEFLLSLASLPEFTVISEGNFKKSQKPYRLEAWGDMLVLQSMIRPDDLSVPEGTDVSVYTGKNLATVRTWATQNAETFDPEEYRNLKQQRISAIGTAEGEIVQVRPKSVAPEEIDIAAMLEASLAAAAPEKPARKSTAKKSAPKLKAVS